MTTRDCNADRGMRRGRQLLAELGRELRNARVAAGVSQGLLGRSAGMSHPQVSRIERAQLETVPLLDLMQLLSVVGLELSVRAFPAGDPIRDAAHERLLGRFLVLVSPPLTWRREVPWPNSGDRRAWDAVINGHGQRTAVEAETALVDVQALQRRLELKMRDGGVDRVILVVAATRRNRAALGAATLSLGTTFPLNGQAILAAVRSGRHPPTSGWLLI